MRNRSLAADYIARAGKRLAALDALYSQESWPDVVREAQEIVELALQGLLRRQRIEAPRIHDVSDLLLDHRKRFRPVVARQIPRLAEVSRRLRRDRELAFYGSEDLTPGEFYSRKDAQEARRQARWVVQVVQDAP